MSTDALKLALKNCLIKFERRVMLTDLLQQYELNYADVQLALEEYITQQESKGVQYEKRFLIKGLERDSNNEVFTVVQGEQKMQDWLQRLQSAESALYSVELVGGTKSPAYEFKPVERHAITIKNLQKRESVAVKPIPTLSNGTVKTEIKSETKTETKPEAKKTTGRDMFAKQTTASTSKPAVTDKPKKTSPELKKTKSPEEKKIKNAAVATSKKGIGNFFAPAAANATVKVEGNKPKESKPNSPKKQQDLFKKQAEKPKAVTTKAAENIKKEANTSVQLFEEVESSASSSDEEEKLEALKRIIITSATSDNEQDEGDAEQPKTSGSKRRRIVDSDEEEAEAANEPQQKIEKKETIDITDDDTPQPQSESYLDEDGFVITIKPKKSNAVVVAGGSKSGKTAKISPKRKSPAKVAAKPAAAATKTKQGNIMNFFSKK